MRISDWSSDVCSSDLTIKPVAYALAVGLIAGPILSSMLGFQILSSTARERSQTAAVAVQAQICATQARIADPKAGELDWSARRDLADHWAIMPGAKEAAPGVSRDRKSPRLNSSH